VRLRRILLPLCSVSCWALLVAPGCSDTIGSSASTGATGGGGIASSTSGGEGASGGAGDGGSAGDGGDGGSGGCLSGTGGGTVRVASWNVESVGAPGTSQHDAALAILHRIDADVVGLNEVNGDVEVAHLDALAFDAGYEESLVADSPSPFGTQRNALLSRLPVVSGTLHTAASLSGDPAANDLTRLIPEVTVNINGCPFTVVVDHWKSGLAQADVFRRAVESHRLSQVVADRQAAAEPFVIVGDVNEELDDPPATPTPFFALPSGLPPGFVAGPDIQAQLASPEGIANNAFASLLSDPPGLTALDALQLDGDDATRPGSGRRLDYLFASAALTRTPPEAEVYDSSDEMIGGGLNKVGDPLPPTTSQTASDHLVVFADLTVPGCTCRQ
jgi:endonuclease/exonuclease/phosphatase family metal-dependent hydrolase